MDNPLKIVIELPYLFSVRDFLFTPVWEEMTKRKDVQFFLLGNDKKVGELISERGWSNISFLNFSSSRTNLKLRIKRILRKDFLTQIWMVLFRVIDKAYLFDSLMYRFAAINDLSHYRIRKEKSHRERKRQQIFYDYRKGKIAGFPFPKSRFVFRLLYELRHSFLNCINKDYLVFLQDLKPDLFVFGRLHLNTTERTARALRRLNIPMIGIVSSWDHPTTKGATPRGMSGYIVASRRMVQEMSVLHGIQETNICQIGKVQMDVYTNSSIFSSRDVFLRDLGLPSDHRLITFGTNTTGLKEHEVSIAQKLVRDFIGQRYGKATLLLRTHPQDVNWKRDFLILAKSPWVVCKSSNAFGSRRANSMTHGNDDQIMLANLMKHSDVVIQSRGSLALDAIAFDTPVISLCFDGNLKRSPNDSFLQEYGFEHYKPLVTAQGTWMVGSYNALDQAIHDYLQDPTIHSEGRKIIRNEHIEPLDGKASWRLVDYLVESAKKIREDILPEGDWNLTGLGDLSWSSRQTCDVKDYVQE